MIAELKSRTQADTEKRSSRKLCVIRIAMHYPHSSIQRYSGAKGGKKNKKMGILSISNHVQNAHSGQTLLLRILCTLGVALSAGLAGI